jgi:hypothetical protein
MRMITHQEKVKVESEDDEKKETLIVKEAPAPKLLSLSADQGYRDTAINNDRDDLHED